MDWAQIILVILGSSVVAAIVTKALDFIAEKNKKDEEKYQKLYGPLTYQLLVMKILENNKKDLMEEIRKTFNNPENRIEAYGKDINPLIYKWKSSVDDIRKLFKDYPGYIKKEDILLVNDFLDGCIKREIIGDGKNQWTNEERTEKLLSAIKALQDKLL